MDQTILQQNKDRIDGLRKENKELDAKRKEDLQRCFDYPNKQSPVYKIFAKEAVVTDKVNSSKILLNLREIDRIKKEIPELVDYN